MATQGGSSNKRSDPGWKYGHLVDQNNTNSITCTFCEKVTNGGIHRHKLHLVGGNRNVLKCLKVPPEVTDEIHNYMNEKKKKAENYDKPPDLDFEFFGMDDVDEDEIGNHGKKTGGRRPGKEPAVNTNQVKRRKGPMDSFFPVQERKDGKLKQTNIIDALDKERRENTVQYIARFFYQAGIAFNVANLQSFKDVVEVIGRYGPGLKPPSYHELRVSLLKKEIDYTNGLLQNHKEEWKRHGCSIMSDAWTDGKERSIINFLVNSSAGTMFIKSVDASSFMHTGDKLFDMLDAFIVEIGVHNVVQVVTDNGSNYVKAGTNK